MTTLYDVLAKHQNNKRDRRTFGLVLQGGGMRAAYVAGAIAPLIQYGFTDSFEHIIGSSAGAINGAYFMAGDDEMRLTYTEDLTNKNFVNLLRMDKRVDIDYLVDIVLKHKRPIDQNKLRRAKSRLHVVLTNATSGRMKVLSKHEQFAKIYEEFRATAAIPLLYDKPVKIGRHWYIDGGVSDLLPIDVAHKLGCTDIVVVMSRQIAGYSFEKQHERLVRQLVRHFAHNQPQAIRRILPTNERVFRTNLRSISHPFKDTRIYLLEPSLEDELISMANIDKPKIQDLAQLGVTDMDSFLHAAITE